MTTLGKDCKYLYTAVYILIIDHDDSPAVIFTESEFMAEMYPLSVSTIDIRISDLVRTTI